MMDELFYKRPDDIEFDTDVVSCVKGEKGYEVVLKDTLFYPEGGGQLCDTGEINGISVIDVQRKEDVIVHTMTAPLEVNRKVHGKIDVIVRKDHTEAHSAEHIISGIVHHMFGYDNVGFHMGEVITMDFNGPITQEQVKDIETKANMVIREDHPIYITYPSSEELSHMTYRSKKELSGTVRIVEVEGIDVCACCGTHVSSTGRIGIIHILSCEKHKQGVRMRMLAGRRAMVYIQTAMSCLNGISKELCVPVQDTLSAVQSTLHKKAQLEGQLHAKILEEAEQIYQSMVEDQKISTMFLTDMNSSDIAKFADRLVKEKHCYTAGVFNKEENGYRYVLLCEKDFPQGFAKVFNAKINGRGGGRGNVIQGSCQAERDVIEKILEELVCEEI